MGFVSVNGVKLNVLEVPQRSRRRKPGVPIVLVHGLGASSAFWYAAGAPALSLLGPCMMYDLRGHGKSEQPPTGYSVSNMVDDLKALMDDRGIERADLVAHSFGGMITLLFALRYPERVRSLVLVDVRVRPLQSSVDVKISSIPPKIARRLEKLGIDVEALSHADDGMEYLKFVARIQIEAGAEAGELLNALYRHSLVFRSPKAAAKWIDLTERASLIEDIKNGTSFDKSDLRQLSQPMFILAGGRSATLTSAEKMAKVCPQAVLKVIPDVGHFFPVSKPKLFLRPTLRFLHSVGRRDANNRL